MKNIKDCMKSRMKKRAEFVKAPYGYRIKDRQLVVEEMEAFRVRSALKFVMDYLNNPPEYMVLEFIDYKKDTQHLVLITRRRQTVFPIVGFAGRWEKK